MWKYDSPIGTLFIKFIPTENRYGFFYNDICWESCDTPQAEASNVYMHFTGCAEWDNLYGQVLDCPTDLSGWEKC